MRLLARSCAVAVTTGLLLAGSTLAQAAVVPAVPTITPVHPGDYHDSLTGALQRTVSALANKASATDPQYFAYGVWNSLDSSCFRCSVGPGVAAAVLAADSGNIEDLSWSTATWGKAWGSNQATSGGFGPPAPGEGGLDIQTAFFLPQQGTSLLLTDRTMAPLWRDRLVSSLRAGADFLIRNGNLSWYTNGNVALANVASMAVAYQVTGDTRYADAYETALAFAVAPPQDRWPGFGLTYTTVPRAAGGSDGKAYFAEKGSVGIGFDADYTQVQADLLARIYMVNRDPRVLRLINLLINQLVPRVDVATMKLDISGGTRLTAAGQTRGFYTPALAILVWLGGRSDLTALLTAQLPAQVREFTTVGTSANAGMYYLVGADPATVLTVLNVVQGHDHLLPRHPLTGHPAVVRHQ